MPGVLPETWVSVRANISPRPVRDCMGVCVCTHGMTRHGTAQRGDAAIPPFFRPALDALDALDSRPAAALGGLADRRRRRSGNVAGGIDSAPQPQPHVCRRAAMIPKPCWPSNGFSAVTRKPLRRRDTTTPYGPLLRLFRYRFRYYFRILPINRWWPPR